MQDRLFGCWLQHFECTIHQIFLLDNIMDSRQSSAARKDYATKLLHRKFAKRLDLRCWL